MKVIAKASQSKYLCEVEHTELEKFFDRYYGEIEALEVGREIDLGKGYNFSTRIEQACKSMTQAMNDFDSARNVMTSFAVAVAKSAGGEE